MIILLNWNICENCLVNFKFLVFETDLILAVKLPHTFVNNFVFLVWCWKRLEFCFCKIILLATWFDHCWLLYAALCFLNVQLVNIMLGGRMVAVQIPPILPHRLVNMLMVVELLFFELFNNFILVYLLMIINRIICF